MSTFLCPWVNSCFADLRNKWHLVIDRLTVLFLKFLEYFHKLQVFMWWILELHIIKIVSSYIIWVSVKEASEHVLHHQIKQWGIIFLFQLSIMFLKCNYQYIRTSRPKIGTCTLFYRKEKDNCPEGRGKKPNK